LIISRHRTLFDVVIAVILLTVGGLSSAQEVTATASPTSTSPTDTSIPPTPIVLTDANTTTPTSSDSLTATTKFTVALWMGPGNIGCYENDGGLQANETVTLLEQASNCADPLSTFYKVRDSDGNEGWVLGDALNLPDDVDTLPELSVSESSTPTPTAIPSVHSDALTAEVAGTGNRLLFDGPGIINCYDRVGIAPGGETVTLLGRASTVCGHSYTEYFYYIRLDDGTEGWTFESSLDLPSDVDSLPILTPVATNTPTVSAPDTPIPPSVTNTPVIPMVTNIPTSGLQVEMLLKTDTTQQSQFEYILTNYSSEPQSGLSVRFYFTTDNNNPISNYVLEKWWDQSSSAVVSGPTLVSEDTYYFTVTYNGTLLPGNSWQYNGGIHLNDWTQTFSSSNDWWRQGGVSGDFVITDTLPVFQNGALVVGDIP